MEHFEKQGLSQFYCLALMALIIVLFFLRLKQGTGLLMVEGRLIDRKACKLLPPNHFFFRFRESNHIVSISDSHTISWMVSLKY